MSDFNDFLNDLKRICNMRHSDIADIIGDYAAEKFYEKKQKQGFFEAFCYLDEELQNALLARERAPVKGGR